MNRSDLADRMKEYEKRNRYSLQKKIPVIVRLDMRAGHTFTKGFQRPFDQLFLNTMQETTRRLCSEIQNVKVGYCQSDEISLLLTDYDNINTDCFFDYRVDKLCSICASMATLFFNREFSREYEKFAIPVLLETHDENDQRLINTYYKAMRKGAIFDARCFNLPVEEVTNYFYWRQLDATRNSVLMIGQANFSSKELYCKTCKDIKSMLLEQKNFDWNILPATLRHGSCAIKTIDESTQRSKWIIDENIPTFLKEGREYIEKYVLQKENSNESTD